MTMMACHEVQNQVSVALVSRRKPRKMRGDKRMRPGLVTRTARHAASVASIPMALHVSRRHPRLGERLVGDGSADWIAAKEHRLEARIRFPDVVPPGGITHSPDKIFG